MVVPALTLSFTRNGRVREARIWCTGACFAKRFDAAGTEFALPGTPYQPERSVSDSALTIALYTGGGLLAVVVIFLGALWFANAAKKGNRQFKWRQMRRVRRRSDADPDRPPSDMRSKGAGPPRT